MLEREVKEISSLIDQLDTALNRVYGIVKDDKNHAEIDNSCRMLGSVRVIDDYIKEKVKELSGVHKWMKEVKVPENFSAHGVTTITVDGYRYNVSHTLRARMTDKEGGMDWLRSNKLGELITETVNAQTLSSAAKAEEEQGRELPEEYFEVYRQPNTSRTKA